MQGEALRGEMEEQLDNCGQGGAPEELATFCFTQDQAMMQDCYSKIVEKLSFANPTMVLQVGGTYRCYFTGDLFFTSIIYSLCLICS